MLLRLLPADAQVAGFALSGHGVRAFLACGTALAACLALGRPAIRCLARLKAAERTEKTPIEDAALRQRIASKSGTPTMGGLFVLAALLATCLLWADLKSPALLAALAAVGALGLVGFADDLGKLRGAGHRERGMKARHKLAAQAAVGLGIGALLLTHGTAAARSVPLMDLEGRLGAAMFVLWAALLLGIMSNATNVTDGLDGLLTGLTPLTALALGAVCWAAGNEQAASRLALRHVPGAGELSVFCGALCGACLGFLHYNRHPARVFMGDTGSLAVGGGLAAAALGAGQGALLLLIGLVFVVEFGSSLLQISFFKLFRRRILPVAPIHHIFEKRGDPEPRIVHGFYLWGAVAALVGLNVVCL
jgi:phospho-N-acetylmuramoyl-pentapeptide-transferase